MGTEARKKPPGTKQILSGIVQSTLYLSKSVCFVVVLRIQYSLFYVIIESGESGVKNGVGKRRESKKRLNANVRGAKSGRRTWVTLFGFMAESKLRENRASATRRNGGR